MATYKLIGQRNLRKYTEPKTSPTYAASIEAQAIVDSLCGIPWKKVAARDATMTYHTEETVAEIGGQKINGLDMNVRIRDEFDAALFCADHAGGQHRAYANAAVYHYVLPDGTLPKLTKLTANVTSDPYNSAGARIAILTNATGEIPTNCNACRTGDAHADGVAPRTVAENGNWFPTTADCVFASPEVLASSLASAQLPSGGLQLYKHLFVFVLMESYSTVRGNWLEGCSYIRNLISIETDAAIPGWTDGDEVDCGGNGKELVIRANNVDEPRGLHIADANRYVLVSWGAEEEYPYGGSIQSGRQAVTEVFARFHNGESALTSGYNLKVGEIALDRGFGAGVFFVSKPSFAQIVLSHALIPFSCPDGLDVKKIRFDWNVKKQSVTRTNMKVVGDVNYNVWITHGLVDNYKADEFSDSGLYDIKSSDAGRWKLIDTFLAADRVPTKNVEWPAESFSHVSTVNESIAQREPYTLLLTAFIGREEVERLSNYAATSGMICEAGMIEGELYDLYEGAVRLCCNCWSPKITLIG